MNEYQISVTCCVSTLVEQENSFATKEQWLFRRLPVRLPLETAFEHTVKQE